MESKTDNSYSVDSELNPCSILLYCYQWTISNFNTLKFVSQQIKSPAFSVGPCKNLDLKLLLTCISNECLKIEIQLSKDMKMTEEVKLREANCPMKSKLSKYILGLEFLNCDGKTINCYKSLPCEFKYINTSVVYAWTKEGNVSRYIQNNSLTICAKLSMRFYSRIDEKVKTAEKGTQVLANDMKKLFYERNRFSDTLLRVEKQYVPCHQSVIHSECSSFMRKIDNDSSLEYVSTAELPSYVCDVEGNNYDVLHLPNENVEVLLSVLHFIYCKQILATQTVDDFDVYQFAKKYDVQELKMFLMPTVKKLHSKIIVGKLNHIWYVKKFSSLNKGYFSASKCLKFETEIGNKIVTWSLILSCLGSNNIVLKLRRTSSFDAELRTFLKLSVCYADGSIYDEIEMRHLFKYGTAQNRKREAMARFTINPDILYNDTLIVCCELSVSIGELSSETEYFYPGIFPTIDLSNCNKNFETLFETSKFSDAILIVGETEFKVHRVILAARSPVFARMFECDMVEKRSGRVKIEDASSKAMKQALHYIYTDKVEDLTLTQAVELYAVADKYDISGLKRICSGFLCQNMDTKDACNILIMSDLYGDIKLKAAAKYKICRNTSEALLSPGGTELISNHPLLFQDILETLSAFLPPLNSKNLIDNF